MDLLLEDRQQFENAREVLPVSGSRCREMAFVAAIVCLGDVKDEPHAICPSARVWPVDCCLQVTPIRAEVTDSPAELTSGISLGFSLGRDPRIFPAVYQGGELVTAVDAELC